MSSPTRSCKHCGAQISVNAQFCKACGKPITAEPTSAPRQAAQSIARKCPHCGATLSAAAVFCKACGKSVASAISIPEAPPIAAPPVLALPGRSQTAQPLPPPAARPRSKKPGLLVGGCVALIMLCLIGAVGVFFVIRSGVITQKRLLNLVGLGPGTITIMNFREDAIQVTFTPSKDSKDDESAGLNLKLSAFAVNSREATRGKYRIEILRQGAGASPEGSCTLTIRSGDSYRYIALPNGIMVDRVNSPSKKAEDLIPETSAFCR